MAAERKQLILVDGSGYIFRAFFALPPMNTSRGLPTRAVYGFIRMILKLFKDIARRVWRSSSTRRKKLFATICSPITRPTAPRRPTTSSCRFPTSIARSRRFGSSRVLDGFEADDVIGTLAKRAAHEHFIVTIITADKDFMQLVGPHVTLWDTMRDRRIGVREVRERFGVEPAALVDIQALTGDTIDNVKGVPGVGEKTAAALVQKFGGVKELYANLDRIEEAEFAGRREWRSC